MRTGDLVEDREGDKAVVREVYEDGYVGIEWDCNPGRIARIHESLLSNLSERMCEDAPTNRIVARVLSLVSDGIKLIAAGGYANAAGALRQAANQLDELA